MPIKLNLACGMDYKDDYTNIDNHSMFPSCKVDIDANVFSLKYPDNSVDEIYISHFLMYIRPEELEILLEEWFSWLKPWGQLVIEQPDISKICKIIALDKNQTRINDFGLINLFGKRGDAPHRWGYTPENIAYLLGKTGFYTIDFLDGNKKPSRDFKIIATK